MHTIRRLAACLIAGYALDATLQSQDGSPAALQCTMEALQRRAPADTTVTAAAIVEASGNEPRYCRVDGRVAVPGNAVSFRLGLPAAWNGKFYFQGVGGLAGTIGPLSTGLARGYASASTDAGHEASDPAWGANRAKEIDYGHRGTHVTAVAARALTGVYYGRPPRHAYFNGCSNGGRQALMEVQRYPTDFDGVIAGDPSMGTPMQVGRALVYQHMLAAQANYLLGRESRAVVGCHSRRVRCKRRTDGRADRRPAALRVPARVAEVPERRRPGVPDGRPGRDGQADLQPAEAAERRDVHAGLPRRPRGRHERMARLDRGSDAAGSAGRRPSRLHLDRAAERISHRRAEHAVSRGGRRRSGVHAGARFAFQPICRGCGR